MKLISEVILTHVFDEEEFEVYAKMSESERNERLREVQRDMSEFIRDAASKGDDIIVKVRVEEAE